MSDVRTSSRRKLPHNVLARLQGVLARQEGFCWKFATHLAKTYRENEYERRLMYMGDLFSRRGQGGKQNEVQGVAEMMTELAGALALSGCCGEEWATVAPPSSKLLWHHACLAKPLVGMSPAAVFVRRGTLTPPLTTDRAIGMFAPAQEAVKYYDDQTSNL